MSKVTHIKNRRSYPKVMKRACLAAVARGDSFYRVALDFNLAAITVRQWAIDAGLYIVTPRKSTAVPSANTAIPVVATASASPAKMTAALGSPSATVVERDADTIIYKGAVYKKVK